MVDGEASGAGNEKGREPNAPRLKALEGLGNKTQPRPIGRVLGRSCSRTKFSRFTVGTVAGSYAKFFVRFVYIRFMSERKGLRHSLPRAASARFAGVGHGHAFAAQREPQQR